MKRWENREGRGREDEDDHVSLRPRITISEASNRDRAVGLVTKAHEQCFIANSVTTQVVVEPEFQTR